MEFKTRNGYIFQVDDEDSTLASEPGWYGHISRKRLISGEYGKPLFFIVRHGLRNGKRVTESLHRVIMNASKYDQIDHRNGDDLDNRKCNLRLCTQSQNNANRGKSACNRSGVKGVCWHSRDNKWHAQIRVKGKRKHLGYFSSKKKAAFAYDQAALQYFGEFARINFT